MPVSTILLHSLKNHYLENLSGCRIIWIKLLYYAAIPHKPRHINYKPVSISLSELVQQGWGTVVSLMVSIPSNEAF